MKKLILIPILTASLTFAGTQNVNIGGVNLTQNSQVVETNSTNKTSAEHKPNPLLTAIIMPIAIVGIIGISIGAGIGYVVNSAKEAILGAKTQKDE